MIANEGPNRKSQRIKGEFCLLCLLSLQVLKLHLEEDFNHIESRHKVHYKAFLSFFVRLLRELHDKLLLQNLRRENNEADHNIKKQMLFNFDRYHHSLETKRSTRNRLRQQLEMNLPVRQEYGRVFHLFLLRMKQKKELLSTLLIIALCRMSDHLLLFCNEIEE